MDNFPNLKTRPQDCRMAPKSHLFSESGNLCEVTATGTARLLYVVPKEWIYFALFVRGLFQL